MTNQYIKSEWEKFAHMHATLEDLAHRYVGEFGGTNESLASITIEGDKLVIKTEAYFSGCGTDYAEYYIPLEWLTESDIMDRCRKQIKEEAAAELDRKNKAAERKQEEKRKQDYKQYLELKEQFGS